MHIHACGLAVVSTKRKLIRYPGLLLIGRIQGAIVAVTVAATIAPTGCGDDRDDDRPVYTCIPRVYGVLQFIFIVDFPLADCGTMPPTGSVKWRLRFRLDVDAVS